MNAKTSLFGRTGYSRWGFFIASLILLLTAGLQVRAAWTPPTSPPPGGNVAAPLNVSGAPQTKEGSLSLGDNLSLSTGDLFFNAEEMGIYWSTLKDNTKPHLNYSAGANPALYIAPGTEANSVVEIQGSTRITSDGVHGQGKLELYNNGLGRTLQLSNEGLGVDIKSLNTKLYLNADTNQDVNVGSAAAAINLCLNGDCINGWPGAGGDSYKVKVGANDFTEEFLDTTFVSGDSSVTFATSGAPGTNQRLDIRSVGGPGGSSLWEHSTAPGNNNTIDPIDYVNKKVAIGRNDIGDNTSLSVKNTSGDKAIYAEQNGAGYAGYFKGKTAVMNGRLIVNEDAGQYASPYELSVQSNDAETWLEILNNGGADKGVFFGIANNDFQMWNYQAGAITFLTNPAATNGTERLRIDNNGNVGIGDASPASLLTVGNGDRFRVDSEGNIIKLRNVTYSWPNVQGATNKYTYLRNDGNGNLDWFEVSGSSLWEHSTAPLNPNTINPINELTDKVAIGRNDIADSTALSVTNNSADKTIYSEQKGAGYAGYFSGKTVVMDGNFGVGNNAPSAALHVTGNARITGLVGCDTIDTDANGNLTCGTDAGGGGGLSGGGVATRVAFWTGATSLGSSANLFWDNNNGRLGIGIGTPQETLHLNSGTIRFGNGALKGCDTIDTDINGNIVCGTDAAGTDAFTVKTNAGDTTAGYLATELVAGTNITLTPQGAGDTKLRIDAAPGINYWTQGGNLLYPNNTAWYVGAGTNNPTSLLTVSSSAAPFSANTHSFASYNASATNVNAAAGFKSGANVVGSGVYGELVDGMTCGAGICAGVYGSDSNGGANKWAGYFDGPVKINDTTVENANALRLNGSALTISSDDSRGDIFLNGGTDGAATIFTYGTSDTGRLNFAWYEDAQPGFTSTMHHLMTIGNDGNVGISVRQPGTRFQVNNGNLFISSPGSAMILRTPDGTKCYKVAIDNAGTLQTTLMAAGCPAFTP